MSAALPSSTIDRRRAEARTVFEGRGIPTRRVEEWKYSDLKTALGEAGFGEDAAAARIMGLPQGLDFADLADPNAPAWVKDHFGTLTRNAVSEASLAFAEGGIALRVPANTTIAMPLSLELSGRGHLRLLLVLEAGASLFLFETGDAAAPRNAGIEIVLGEGASLEHVRLGRPVTGVQVEEIGLSLAARARYNAHFAGFGATLSRIELTITLEGEGAEAHLSGVSVLSDAGHADITTHLIHATGNTNSTQLFKKVAAGKSRAVYQGRVTVAKGADGADSRQTAKALLLSDTAEADLKPELEIFADDVKCAHGAAIGDLEPEQLFYLRARGISEPDARALLIHAFLEDALGNITRDDVRNMVRTAIGHALVPLL